jgi:uncharacterized SAM-binding protein YcdF (DUF218 family)
MSKAVKLALAIIAVFIGFILFVDNFLVEDQAPQKSDFIVVISGGDTLARTKKGVELYKQAYAPKLLLSGDAADPQSPSNAKIMKRVAVANGVKEEDIVIEENSKDTRENATESILKLIQVGPEQQIILVTSPYHSHRARAEFEEAFKKQTISAKVISVNAEDKNWSRFWWIKPKSLIIAFYETIKLPVVLIRDK